MHPITTPNRGTLVEETQFMQADRGCALLNRRWGAMHVMALVLVTLLVGSAAWSQKAHAAPLSFTSVSASALNSDGSAATQAGGHPFEIQASFGLDTVFDPRVGAPVPTATLKDTTFDLPPGVIGDPGAVPKCRQQDMNALDVSCATDTQVGWVLLDVNFVGGRQPYLAPIYNMVPPAGEPAQFAFVVVASVAHIDLSVRTDGDYGVRATVHNANATTPVYGATIHLWGVPADSSHDAMRFLPRLNTPGDLNGNPIPSTLPRKPFLRNPTLCGGAVTTMVQATSYQEPKQIATADAHAPAVTGCDQVPFDPSIAVTPDTRAAGSSAGMGIDVGVAQTDDPDVLASSDLRRVVTRLPAGVTINPSASDGLAGCTDAQFGKNSLAEDQCPNGAKVGSVTIDTPLLDTPLKGDVFIGAPLEQNAAAAANGRMFRLFLTANGSGVRVKLTGSITTNPVTGQLTTVFDNTPQVPFNTVHLQLVGGSRAPLATPKTCGTYTTTADMSPWSAPNSSKTVSSSFVIDQNCAEAGKFNPSFSAGLVNQKAGASSAFTLLVGRPSGQQDLKGLNVTLPPGLLAHVGSVPLCADAQAAAGTCSAASQIGHVRAASGVGDTPVSIPQPGKAPTGVYLSGPYKDAPYSLSIVVPAQAGPFDLGTVVVRAQLKVDPVDAHATVISDPLPTILLGVPLSIQGINVVIDRPGFMQSPTNCAPMAINAQVGSATTVVDRTSPFQVTGCKTLKVQPDYKFALSGKGQTTDGKHPAFTAELKMPAGDANIKNAKVTLPLSLALDPNNSQSDDLCEFDVGKQTIPQCPKSSIVGTATAVTPLLNVPVTGPVYFVKNVRIDPKSGRQIRTLPTLAIPLQGGGITLVLRATSDVVNNHLVTTFANVPDAPVTSFKLSLNGGKKAILVVSGTDICKGTQTATHVTTGHNNATAKGNIVLATPCALGIVASSHTSTALKVTVSGLSAGTVSVSGDGLTKTSRTITDATTATLEAKLSDSVRSRLAHHHDVKLKVKVSFTPKGSSKVKTSTKTITLHG